MVTAIAPANIAFIKYWGKKDATLNIPFNDSISMNLSEAYTTTSVEFSSSITADEVHLDGAHLTAKEISRMTDHLDRIRGLAHSTFKARVVTKNTFPKSSGIASSASGFAALTLASSKALGLSLNEKELSILARLGSGSASRSIPDGFVEWKTGEDSDQSYAYSLYLDTYWDLRDVLVIVASSSKKISSREGHGSATSSPFFHARLMSMSERIDRVKEGLKKKDLGVLGPAIEEEAINMHASMMTQRPSLFYWTGATIDLIHAVMNWREEGLPVYFTIDAGPNMHLICESKDAENVAKIAKAMKGVEQVIINKPARGAHLV